MTEEEVSELLLRWTKAKGGYFTEQELEALVWFLEEHFPQGPEKVALEQVLAALSL